MSSNIKKRKVFVIEDNKTEGMLLKLCLGSIRNISITNFVLGEELLKNIDENPDILVADLMLPDIAGYDLIKQVKQTHPETPVIVCSAQRDMNLVAKLQELGVHNYIVKSESCIEYLQQVIEDLLLLIEKKEEIDSN